MVLLLPILDFLFWLVYFCVVECIPYPLFDIGDILVASRFQSVNVMKWCGDRGVAGISDQALHVLNPIHGK